MSAEAGGHVRTLLFIRHAESRIDPSTPPEEWILTARGRDRTARLAPLLARFAPTRLLTSPEPKAAETATVLSDCLGIDPECLNGLREQDRNGVPFFPTQDEFDSYVAEVFRSSTRRLLGPESAEEAYGRFSSQVEDALRRYPDGCIAFVSHGTVMSLFVGRAAGIEPYDVWCRLGMPSYVALSRPGGRLIEAVFDADESVVPADELVRLAGEPERPPGC